MNLFFQSVLSISQIVSFIFSLNWLMVRVLMFDKETEDDHNLEESNNLEIKVGEDIVNETKIEDHEDTSEFNSWESGLYIVFCFFYRIDFYDLIWFVEFSSYIAWANLLTLGRRDLLDLENRENLQTKRNR